MHVALFGGSFNPPHVGHLLGAALVRAVAGADRVWLMPAWKHRFGKELAPFDDRLALCEALAPLVSGLEATAVERDLPGDGRTLPVVEHLVARHPQHRFSLVVGTDILSEAPRWYRFDRLVQLAPLVVLRRSGAPAVPAPAGATTLGDVPIPAVSSTDVRARLARGGDVSHLVPAPVLAEIRARGLYRQNK